MLKHDTTEKQCVKHSILHFHPKKKKMGQQRIFIKEEEAGKKKKNWQQATLEPRNVPHSNCEGGLNLGFLQNPVSVHAHGKQASYSLCADDAKAGGAVQRRARAKVMDNKSLGT